MLITYAYLNEICCFNAIHIIHFLAEIVCEAPFVPKNGEVRISSKKFGSKAIFDCLPGYVLDGNRVIHCKEGGFWDNEEPQCKGKILLIDLGVDRFYSTGPCRGTVLKHNIVEFIEKL